MKTAFGNNLRALREKQNLTQRDLASKLNTTHTTIANYENGGKYPQREDIKKSLLKVLDCEEVDLYGYSDGYYSRNKFISTATPANKEGEKYSKASEKLYQDEECLVNLKNNKFYKISRFKRAIDKAITKKYPNGKFLKVEDDSMDRYLPKNSYAYVTREEDIKKYENRVCAITIDGFHIIFRRVSFLDFDNLTALVPQSNNKNHRSITVNTDEDPDFKIFGRVVWFSNDGTEM